jgi:hypothetical protein
MGCSDARATNSPPTNSSSTPRISTPIHLSPEYASAVTLPRISSESVKKMALAQRKKAF